MSKNSSTNVDDLEIAMDGFESASAVSGSFFHITNPRDTSGLCYAVSTMVNWKRFNLVQGQIAWFSTPAGGVLNRQLELALYVMVARIRNHRTSADRPSESYGRWEIMLDGMPDAAATALPGESAVYGFTPDSYLGYLGNQVTTRCLDRRQVEPLVHFATNACIDPLGVRMDGHQPWQPTFYCECAKGEDGTPMWEVTRETWIKVRPLGKFETPLFLPSVNKDEQWVAERYKQEIRLGNRLGARDIYVGNSTMELPEHNRLEVQSMRHDHHDGFAMQMHAGIRPVFSRVARMNNRADNVRHLNQTLNAYGEYIWRASLDR